MKIKLPSGLLFNEILVFFFLLALTVSSFGFAQIILGMAMLFFSPGYALVSTLFVNSKEINGLERIALIGLLSFGVVSIIGFTLNYTSLGISIRSAGFSISVFTLVMSGVAQIRQFFLQHRIPWFTDFRLVLPKFYDDRFNKYLGIILIFSIFGSLGFLGYTAVYAPKSAEAYSEFYILGLNGQAATYPSEFILNQSQVTHVFYGETDIISEWGMVTIGITNQEGKTKSYSVLIDVKGAPSNLYVDGKILSQLGPISIDPGLTWEKNIGFAPNSPGNNQEVDFLLYIDGQLSEDNSLTLWVNANDAT